MKFKEIFVTTASLAIYDNTRNNVSAGQHLCKLTEEVGELAQEVNKTIGRKTKKVDETDESIRANILEEGADVIQCVIAILASKGIEFEELKKALCNKNIKYSKGLGILKEDELQDLS